MADGVTMLIFAVFEVWLQWLLQRCSEKPWFWPLIVDNNLIVYTYHVRSLCKRYAVYSLLLYTRVSKLQYC
jgi:hypothetical protein